MEHMLQTRFFANQTTNWVFSQNLDALFDTLVSQSSAAKFYKIAAGSGQSSIAGLFQCRGDLSASDCSDCVQITTDMSKNLYGDSIAGRVQLVYKLWRRAWKSATGSTPAAMNRSSSSASAKAIWEAATM
nr:cysteine-rich repeat secretory protein 3 [Ipomoea trifida]GLL41808.1 cysteine-rich repeat secretory protein 3 [Ipomoea trifida]GLL47416.1 cysteine-rich repeat secretory protein 3 [Ipomoea trifida]